MTRDDTILTTGELEAEVARLNQLLSGKVEQ